MPSEGNEYFDLTDATTPFNVCISWLIKLASAVSIKTDAKFDRKITLLSFPPLLSYFPHHRKTP